MGDADLRELLKMSSLKHKKADDDERKEELKRKVEGQITEYTQGDSEGIEEVKAMLEEDPDNVELQDWLAFMLYSNNLLDEAIELYKKLLAAGHRSDNQHFYLGNAYYKKGLVKLAIEEWKRVIELDPKGKLAEKARFRIERAEKGEEL